MPSASPTDPSQDCDPRWPADLRPEHRNYLWERGVTPEAARARGYRSVRGGGGRNVDESYAAAYHGLPRRHGLLMPLHPLLGGDQRYQLRPDEPRLSSDQKPVKFESQAGLGNMLATSPLTASALRRETPDHHHCGGDHPRGRPGRVRDPRCGHPWLLRLAGQEGSARRLRGAASFGQRLHPRV